jgi:hypothetical protein
MFAYLESTVTDINGSGSADMNDGYVNFPSAVNTETMQPGRGYALFVRGDKLSSTLWDVRGNVNVANETPITFPVTYTAADSISEDGWNLVGNPFPSTIDWSSETGWIKQNL